MFLTKQGGFIVRPIATLLGKFMSLIYEFFSSMGIVSIGLSIIVFTLLVRLLLVPLMFKTNKSSKVMAYIQPEINKVTKKYKGKKDQESLMAQQRETKAIQDKYGVSMTGGCLTSLIQMPIFFAVYNVIRNIPAYVGKVRNLYEPIANKIYSDSAAFEALKDFKENGGYSVLSSVSLEEGNVNTIIDVLAKFPSEAWDAFSQKVSSNQGLVDAISANKGQIIDTYSFLGGIDLTSAPGFALTAAFLIPVLSMVFQFMSMKATPQQSGDPSQEQTMKTMRNMMYIFPIMSFLVCVNVPAGVGLYWAMGSLISFFTSLSINYYFKKCDMEKIIGKCMAKAEKKRAKRKAKGKKTFMEKMQEAAYGKQPETNVNNRATGSNLKSYNTSSMNKSDNSGVRYREGSLAAKANAMQRYKNNDGGKN